MDVNFNSIKVGYSQGDAFTYGGSDYTGYFTILSGVPYKGRFEGNERLQNKPNYTNNVLTSEYLFDRTLTDSLSLAYDIEDFKVPNGMFITAENINPYFKKFQDNTTYLYSRLFVYDSNLPSNVLTTISVSGNDDPLRFYPANYFTPGNFTVINFVPGNFTTNMTTSGYNFDIIKSVAFKIDETSGNFALFTAASTTFVAITGNLSNPLANPSSVVVALCTNLINQQPDDLPFLDIIGMEVIDDFLFVLDQGRNCLTKYNIYNFYSGDNSLPEPKITVEIKSGGGRYQPSTFNKPNLITVTDTDVIIYQQTDRYFKRYDINLNLINFANIFRRVNEEVLAIGYNKFFKLLCCIVKTGLVYSFYYLDDNFNIVQKYDFGIKLAPGEVLKKILFSENDSNIFYITTNKFVYKSIVGKPEYLIGVFSNERLKIIDSESGNFLGVALAKSNNNYDTMVLAKNNRFIVLQEPNVRADLLKTNDFVNYPIEDVNLDKSEYMQANYINKELFKVFDNIIRIKNQVVGSFAAEYKLTNQQLTYEDSLYTPSLVLVGRNYFENYDFLNITNDFDFFIHENEPVNNVVLNRCFSNLYKLQESILLSTKVSTQTLVPYISTDNCLYLE